jgi:hypothetical protein
MAAFRRQHAALAELLGGAFLAALPQPPEIPMDTNPP